MDSVGAEPSAARYNMLGDGPPSARGTSPRRLVNPISSSVFGHGSDQPHNPAYAAVYQRKALQVRVPRDVPRAIRAPASGAPGQATCSKDRGCGDKVILSKENVNPNSGRNPSRTPRAPAAPVDSKWDPGVISNQIYFMQWFLSLDFDPLLG
eukprot:SAG31_NODE_6661_length_1934_cov_1.786921_2_plen_152_part_00